MRRGMEVIAAVGVVGFIPWMNMLLPKSWTGVNLIEEAMTTINSSFNVS